MRRRRRRRLLVGGMVLLTVGGTAAAIKLSQKDVQRIEQHTGAAVDELEEQELTNAMRDLGIQSAALTPEDKAALAAAPPLEADESADKFVGDDLAVDKPADENLSYIEELQKLAGLRDQGIITEAEFEAKKQQLLGL
jgi:hypothetical protein